jgi:hypothetical protein
MLERIRKRPVLATVLLLTSLVLVGLSGLCVFVRTMTKPLTDEAVVGTWVVDYSVNDRYAGRDTLILKRDHTFIQICVSDKNEIKRVTGTWALTGDDGGRALMLDGILGPPQARYLSDETYRFRDRGIAYGSWYVSWVPFGLAISLDYDDVNMFRKVK